MIHIDNPAVPSRTEGELRKLAAAAAMQHRRTRRRRQALLATTTFSAVAMIVASLGSPLPTLRAHTTGWADRPPAAGPEQASTAGDEAVPPSIGRPTELRPGVPGAAAGIPLTEPTPGAPSRPVEGRIAFVDGGGITVMAFDGTGRRSVSTKGSGPAWAPGGGRLAFTEDGDLWEYDFAHGARRLLVHLDNHSASRPSWSPRGDAIVFSAFCNLGCLDVSRSGLWLYDTGTGGARWLRRGEHGSIRHDGTIVYDCGEGLCLTDATGADRGPVPNSSSLYEPTWSPDGGRIAAGVVNGGVAVIGADGSERRTVSTKASGRAAWFPDGTRIAARYTPGRGIEPCTSPCAGEDGIWSMRLDGSDAAMVVSGSFAMDPDIAVG